MTVRQIAVYDGQRMIGTLIEHADRTCVAKDAAGKKLGTFPTIKGAADRISEADNTSRTSRRSAQPAPHARTAAP